jgi:hypothetical protein
MVTVADLAIIAGLVIAWGTTWDGGNRPAAPTTSEGRDMARGIGEVLTFAIGVAISPVPRTR